MTWIEALILGILQGLTEFLPVSSSGHLELGKAILGNDQIAEESLMFTVLLHCATVLSTIIVFRKDIHSILKGFFQFQWNEDTQYVAKVVFSMIPVMIIGLFFEDQIESLFTGKIILVGIMLIVTGMLLLFTAFYKHRSESVSFPKALIIGIAQAVAVLPGISRSGATLSTGLLLGVDRAKIARFSFLMVILPILGATVLMLKDIATGESSIHGEDATILIVGFLGAFIAGLLACTWMINLVKKGKIQYFAYYCFLVGIIAIITGWSN